MVKLITLLDSILGAECHAHGLLEDFRLHPFPFRINTFDCPDLDSYYINRYTIVVDFTESSAPNMLEVRIGLTNDTEKIIAHTKPVTLLPGVNLVATTSMHIRQTFSSPLFSGLGLFEVSFYFIGASDCPF